ncbi:GNAT family N-acetyltransferase [Pseudoduganella violaceinigra]|uniref:GNAT family N-acetyltransferase n=1 Tax=Pseudoduganella violaceinigra TaxID=246602 RepID=UPI0004856F47|nr:GNAT family N-acetyltransferase [Pseudoduganella violaceinigra]
MPSRTSRSIEMRPAEAGDLAFMQQLYSSTRSAEVRMGGCDLATETLLQGLQFKAQQTWYETQYPNADLAVIMDRERPVGRLFVDYGPGELRILDICLLPEYRNRGIGLGLLRSLQAQGERLRLPVRVNLALGSPAQHLFVRCGFELLAVDGMYNLMEWLPPAGIDPD